MTLPVFRASSQAVAAAAAAAAADPGAQAQFGAEVAGHAIRVRRMRPGEALDIVDGAGLRVRGTLESGDAEHATLRIDAVQREASPDRPLVLVQALAKGDRDLQAIEAAAEVGVDAVVPWAAERSIADWPAKKAERMAQKWDNQLVAASLQSRRSRFPELHPLVRGTGMADLITDFDTAIVLDEAAAVPLAQALREAGLVNAAGLPNGAAPPGRLLFVVGPEGGITAAEVAAAQARGARTAVLGPTVLRASTAGPIAIALAQQLLGRWDGHENVE